MTADIEDLAGAVEALFPKPMADLSNFDHDARRECLAEGEAETEARETLAEGLRWLKEDRKDGVVDLSWLPEEARAVLVRRRVEALKAWVAAIPA